MKRLRSVLGLVVLIVVALVGATPAHADDDHPTWRVQRYEQRVSLDAAGTAAVRLDLYFDFANDPGRGPYLWFPLRQEVAGDPDVWRVFDVTVNSVTSTTGASTELRQQVEDGNLVLRIGSENRKDRRGVQHYVIDYTIRGLVEPGASSGLDEFNWNAVGLGWTVPLSSVRVELTGPVAAQRTACFQGRAFDRPCEAGAPASTVEYSAGPLRKGEGVQVVAGYPAGTFVGAEPRYAKRYHIGNMFPLTPASAGLTGALAALGLGALLLQVRRSRDVAYVGLTPGLRPVAGQETRVAPVGKTPVAVQFRPPEGARPGELGTLIDGSAGTIDVTATLVDLAVRGHLRITELEKKKWQFDRLDNPEPLTKPEKNLLSALFSSGPSVRSDAIKPKQYQRMFPGTKTLLDKRVTTELGWFRRRPGVTRAGVYLVGVGLMAGGLALGLVLAFTLGLGLAGLAPIVVGVVTMALAGRFTRRTPDGTAVLAQTRGFELYLRTAEADQIKFEESIDVFSRYLPYAIVFGVAERWAKVFQDLAAQGRYTADTSWYVGPYGSVYNPGFAHSIGDLGHQLGAQFAASAAPRGGSGGGSGFSGGGGFGGGGGGGW
nr:DUF2207 domain-containing protein [Propionibacterium sp.]